MTDRPELIVADAEAWRRWLASHHQDSAGVWLVLTKKGTGRPTPTSLTYDQALDEALCHGWIDGQVRRRDDATYVQRFTPRTPRSAWSRRNVDLASRLAAEGRMHSAGKAAVEQAQADGRWGAAYAGPATIEVPADLGDALAANPRAQAMFDLLTSRNRFAILYRLGAAKRPDTRPAPDRIRRHAGPGRDHLSPVSAPRLTSATGRPPGPAPYRRPRVSTSTGGSATSLRSIFSSAASPA